MARGRSPTLTSVVARRPVAVSSIDAAGSGFALIRRARLPSLCPPPGHPGCRLPLLRRTHCFSGLGPLIDLVPANLAASSFGLWSLPAALLTGFRATGRPAHSINP